MMYHVLMRTQCLGLMKSWIGWAWLDFFSTLDLTKGYWQIPLSPESKEKNGFLHTGRYVPI